MAETFPGQSLFSWGHPSQVASCCSHSAGIQRPRSNGVEPVGAVGMRLFAQPAVQDGAVSINAAIAEKWPVAARVFAFCGITLDHEDFLFVIGRFSGDLAERIGDERVSPEFEAGIAVSRLALETDAIYDGDVDPVGDGMRALDGFPRVKLRGTEFRFFVWVPSD